MSKKVMLIDGSSLIFRAFFALPNLTNADGVMTNGVYGFLTMYFRAVEEYKPDYILKISPLRIPYLDLPHLNR